jgi:hypothetical protein
MDSTENIQGSPRSRSNPIQDAIREGNINAVSIENLSISDTDSVEEEVTEAIDKVNIAPVADSTPSHS